MQQAGISTQAGLRVKLQLWNSWNSNWAHSWYSNWIESEDVKQRHAMWNAHMESDFNQRQKLFETTLSGTCAAAGWCNGKKCRLANLKSLTPGPACCFKSECTHKTELDVGLSLNPPRSLMGRAAASERPGNLGLNVKWMPVSRRASQLWHNCQTWNNRQQVPTPWQWLLQVWVRRHRVLSARPGPGKGSITSQA